MKSFLFLITMSLFVFACGSENGAAINKNEWTDNQPSKEALLKKGQVLFSANCKVCHSLEISNPTGLAPVLDSVAHYWPNKELLAQFISNAPENMQATEHTRQVYRKWKDKSQMPPFSGLDAQEIESIIEFIYMY